MKLILGFLMGIVGGIGMLFYGFGILATLFAVTQDTIINDESANLEKPYHKRGLKVSIKMFGFYFVITVIAFILLITL